MAAFPSGLVPFAKTIVPVGKGLPVAEASVAVITTVCPVETEDGATESTMEGRGSLLTVIPVPRRAMPVEEVEPLVLMVSVPVREPAAAGLKATLNVQLW